MEQLSLLLAPRWDNNTVADMTIFSTFPSSGLSQNLDEPVLSFPDQAFGGLCPFPEWSQLTIRDEFGDLPYEIKPCASITKQATFKGIYLARNPIGLLEWSITLLPRILPDGYRSSPYYDFRAEPYGLNGSGMFSFILPTIDWEMPLAVHLDWDLSKMPLDARGIWSYGEGAVDIVLTKFQIMSTLFNTGVMQAVESKDFGIYWFSEPDFDVRSIAERILPIYQYEKAYFNDSDSYFRVFLRRDPFKISEGGSACPHAFISGYSAFGNTNTEHLFRNLLHEMTHTWPAMDDINVGEGTWFNEGATEYYSTLLPYWGGFLDAGFTAASLNEKIGLHYLNNPYRETPNDKIPAIQWKERLAQTVPYGRGFYYLANVEAKLKRLNLGSIDEIVKRHLKQHRMTVQNWRDFIFEKLGDSGIRDFEDMCAGKIVPPEDNLFGSQIITKTDKIELNGQPQTTYFWEVKK